MTESKHISLKRFLQFFEEQRSKQFCFILGSGASKSSGIPTGEELARIWFKQIQEYLGGDEFEEWAADINKDHLGRSYHKIFAKKFDIDPRHGYDVLERLIESAHPSIGYVFLSRILTKGRHNIVITTNFDTLTEDSLLMHTLRRPLVIGHSDLAGYINARLQRPQVIKVHHDLLFSPKNTETEAKDISEDLEAGLKEIFQIYTPIIIGYGGNDRGFMKALGRVLNKENGFYWCVRDKETPRDGINSLVKEKNGRFVIISNFDELMISIGNKIKLNWEPEKAIQIAKRNEWSYAEKIRNLYANRREDAFYNLSNDLDEITGRGDNNWLTYRIKVDKETDNSRKETLYQEGLSKIPGSYQLLCGYADFLTNVRGNYEEAEAHYQTALNIDPNNPIINMLYALFLFGAKGNHNEAEICYLKMLAINPNDPSFNISYGTFLAETRGDYVKAERYFRTALELAPYNSSINALYADFLSRFRNDYEKADEYFQVALDMGNDSDLLRGLYNAHLTESRDGFNSKE